MYLYFHPSKDLEAVSGCFTKMKLLNIMSTAALAVSSQTDRCFKTPYSFRGMKKINASLIHLNEIR